jgi:hypothetical protein
VVTGEGRVQSCRVLQGLTISTVYRPKDPTLVPYIGYMGSYTVEMREPCITLQPPPGLPYRRRRQIRAYTPVHGRRA